jgi:hypothetical protein
MAATGRPTMFDDIKAQRILAAIKGGSSRACAAGLVGVAVSTLYAWMAANPEFLDRGFGPRTRMPSGRWSTRSMRPRPTRPAALRSE